MPFCAAAAIVHGRVGVETFERELADARTGEAVARHMRADPSLDASPPR